MNKKLGFILSLSYLSDTGQDASKDFSETLRVHDFKGNH